MRWADPALLEDEYQFCADRPVGAFERIFVALLCVSFGVCIGALLDVCG